MHIDAHQHFWIYDPREYDWIDDSMAALRRDFLPDGPERRNWSTPGFRDAFRCRRGRRLRRHDGFSNWPASSPFILGVVGWVDLQSPDVRSQLQAFARNPKLVGIRHVVQAEPDDRFLLRPEFLRGISVLEEFDLAYDILIYTKHLPVAAEFVRQFPRQRFVLDHLAKPPIKSGSLQPWERGIRELAGFPNVFCKLSGLVTEADWQQWKPEHVSAISGCGLRMLRAGAPDDRVRLAGVHCGRFVFPCHGSGEGLHWRPVGPGAGSRSWEGMRNDSGN